MKYKDKSELPEDQKWVYEQADLQQRRVEGQVARLREDLKALVSDITSYRNKKAQLLGRRMVRTDRPSIPIEEHVREKGRPITFEEAVLAAGAVWKIAMNLEPEGDVRRAITGSTTKLKMINGMVGLIEWPDEMFGEKNGSQI